jgi:hypothetical protein
LRLHSAIAPPAVPAPALASVTPQTLLRWLAIVPLLLSAMGVWWYVHAQAMRDARARLRAACRKNDARGARDALLEWRKAAGATEPLAQRIGAEWQALDAALYADRAWDGEAFWRSVRPRLRKSSAARAAPKAPLPPFFRLQAPRR